MHTRRDELGEAPRRLALGGRPLEADAQLAPGRAQHALVELVPGAHRLAVDGNDAIAGAQIGLGRRLPGEDGADGGGGRARLGARQLHEHERGEGDVRQRSGEDDAQALPRRAQREGERLLVGIDVGVVALAEQAHVAAERNDADGVLGAAARPAHQRAAEADLQLLHAHTEQPRHHEVPELMHGDEHADEQREPDQRHRRRSTTMAAWSDASGRGSTV